MKHKWLYKVERMEPPVFANAQKRAELQEEALNRHGLDGWELVNIVPIVRSGTINAYFKKLM